MKKAKLKSFANPLDFLVIDEIYSYENRKNNRVYIWTAIGFNERGEKLCFAHVDRSKGDFGLLNFCARLPRANQIFCDGNIAYRNIFGSQAIVGKGIKTNLVESLNSQLRQYVSRLRRKTKAYAKSMKALEETVHAALIQKII